MSYHGRLFPVAAYAASDRQLAFQLKMVIATFELIRPGTRVPIYIWYIRIRRSPNGKNRKHSTVCKVHRNDMLILNRELKKRVPGVDTGVQMTHGGTVKRIGFRCSNLQRHGNEVLFVAVCDIFNNAFTCSAFAMISRGPN